MNVRIWGGFHLDPGRVAFPHAPVGSSCVDGMHAALSSVSPAWLLSSACLPGNGRESWNIWKGLCVAQKTVLSVGLFVDFK